MELTVDDVRLEDPGFYFEGRPQSYERLHAECPVFYYRPLDVFVLTKHEDIKEAARRPEIFSSAHGLHLHELRLAPEEVTVYATLYGQGQQFAYADPPRHRLISDFVWSHEPHRVKRRARDLPVYLVLD